MVVPKTTGDMRRRRSVVSAGDSIYSQDLEGDGSPQVNLDIYIRDLGVRSQGVRRSADPAIVVPQFCDKHNIRHDEEIFRVLIRDGRKGEIKEQVVHSFLHCLEKERLRLEDGGEVVLETLENLETGIRNLSMTFSEDKVTEALGWTHSLLLNTSMEHQELNSWYNEEVLDNGGFETLLRLFIHLHKIESAKAAIALVGSVLGSLVYWMKFSRAHGMLEESNELINVELCEALLATLFGRRLAATFNACPCDFSSDTRRMAFLFLYYLLKNSKKSQVVFHQTCHVMNHPNMRSYYHILASAALDVEKLEHGYARILLNLLVMVPELRVDALSRIDMVDQTGRVRQLCSQPLDQMCLVNEELLVECCTSSTISAELGKADSKSSLLEEIEQIKKQNKVLSKRKMKVEYELRKMHQAMSKMVDFVDVRDDLVNQSLNAIIRFGWDSVNWQRGYTALHFAAECSDDHDLVELLAVLATDFNCRDEDGFRPLDYARKQERKKNVHVLEKLRERTVRERRAQDALNLAGPSLDLPDDLTPTLRTGLEAVLQLGWKELTWPRGFTALHLAAQSGHLMAVQILLEKVEGVAEDINRVDERGRRAIDYATESNHTAVAEYLENFDPSTLKEKREAEEDDTMASAINITQTSVGKKRKKTASIKKIEVSPFRPGSEVPPEVTSSMRRMCEEILSGQRDFSSDNLPLHRAAKLGDVSAIYFLLQQGLAVDQVDSAKQTALDCAKQYDNKEAAAVLEEAVAEAERKKALPPEEVEPEKIDHAKLARELAQSRQQLRSFQFDMSDERQTTISNRQLKAKVKNLQGQLETGKAGYEIGPLQPDAIQQHMVRFVTFGEEAFRGKLMENTFNGGQNLDSDEAAEAVEQMRAAAAAADAEASGATQKPMRRKGVGPVCPKCRAAEDEDEETPSAPSAPKGKGKAPPVPGGKGGPSTEDEETPAVAGKGKGKGPPVPGGKGPPVPGGKGPPVPGGKGPPLPGGKGGPPAPPGKGGAKGPGKGGKLGKGGPAEDVWKPPKPMKSLWWNALKFKQIKEPDTVWKEVEKVKDEVFKLLEGELMEEFVARFGKQEGGRGAAKRGDAAAKKEAGQQEKKKEKPKIQEGLRVITDPQLIVGREAALKGMPSPDIVAKAVIELDDVILGKNLLEVVRANCIPTQAQVKQLEEIRKSDPVSPWALPEKYLWVIGRIPAYQQRIDCWYFVRSYGELLTHYEHALNSFLAVVECMRQSKTLPTFLAIILAVGNYLNGGTNRGNADGFDFETLTKLDTVKDNDGKKHLLHYLIELFLCRLDIFKNFADDFGPDLNTMLANVRRRIQRDSDGTEKLDKSVLFTLEDFDQLVKALEKEFEERHQSLQMCLQFIDDPADPLRIQLSPEYAEAKEDIGRLVMKKEKCKTQFAELQKYFNISASTTSGDFVMLWDNVFVPADLVINKPEAMKKKQIVPMFCQGKAIERDSMLVLWEMKQKRKRRSQKSRGRVRSGVGSRGSRGSRGSINSAG